MNNYSSFTDFANYNTETAFCFLVYNRMKKELEGVDSDFFESDYINVGIIEDIIMLADNDPLIGFRMVDNYCVEDGTYELLGSIEYYKLSEIRLSRFTKKWSGENCT